MLVVAKTVLTESQNQNRTTPGHPRLRRTMAVVDPMAAEACPLLQPACAGARDHRNLPMAAELTQRLRGSHMPLPEPIKLRLVAGAGAVLDQRDFLLHLAATSSMSPQVGDHSGAGRRPWQLQKAMLVSPPAVVPPGIPPVQECFDSIQPRSFRPPQLKGPAVQFRAIDTGRQAPSFRGRIREMQLCRRR